jgi:hypothetical protein
MEAEAKKQYDALRVLYEGLDGFVECSKCAIGVTKDVGELCRCGKNYEQIVTANVSFLVDLKAKYEEKQVPEAASSAGPMDPTFKIDEALGKALLNVSCVDNDDINETWRKYKEVNAQVCVDNKALFAEYCRDCVDEKLKKYICIMHDRITNESNTHLRKYTLLSSSEI